MGPLKMWNQTFFSLCLLMIPTGLYCIQRLGNIFPDIYCEYIRLQDRVKHSNPLLQLWHLRITSSWNNMNLPHNLLSGYILISRLNSGSLHWHFEVATLNILWLLRNLYQLSRKKKYYANNIYMIYFKGRRWLKFKEGGIKCKITFTGKRIICREVLPVMLCQNKTIKDGGISLWH